MDTGRDAQLALLVAEQWRDEIEQAINRVKKPVNRLELGRWFRKQWYMMEARYRREHSTGKPTPNRQAWR
jgi:hypothetical protein